MKKTDLSFLPREIAVLVRPVLEGPPSDVAFDADGTLWANDIGDTFLQTLDERKLLPQFPNGGAWSAYQSRYLVDPYKAYEFSAMTLAGMTEAEVEAVAKPLAELFALRNMFAPMSSLVRLLQQANHRVWVVSASNVWCVRAAADLLEIPPKRVLGVELEQYDRGILLPIVKLPAPIGPGKVDAIKRAGFRPALAAGNSLHDGPMLGYAASAFVVRDQRSPDSDAAEMADQRNWPTLII